MNKETFKPRIRRIPEGSSSVDFIGKILKEEGNDIVFSLSCSSFLDIYLDPLANKTSSYCIVGVDEIVTINYMTSGKSIKLSLNDSHDLFTLLYSDIPKLKYDYPENETKHYIITKNPILF